MSDQHIRDELVGMFVAGHETTASTLSWIWYVLSTFPEIEARVHAELETVLGGHFPTVEQLPQLHYTRMVISETLRLYQRASHWSGEPEVPMRSAAMTFLPTASSC